MLDLESVNNLLFYFLVPFLLYSVYFDIKKRKVKNSLNLFIFIFSIIFLVLNIFNFDFYKFLTIIFVFFLSFLLYNKNIWGAGDGKLFISLSIILISVLDYYEELNFLLNIVSFYSIIIVFLVLYKLNRKEKVLVIKKIDFYYEFLIILVLFLIFGILHFIFKSYYSNFTFLFFLFVIMFLILYRVRIYLKKVFKRVSTDDKLIILSILFLSFLVIGKGGFVFSFLLVIFIKFFIQFFANGSEVLIDEKKYSTPFVIFLVFSFIFTYITKSNIVIIFVYFIKSLV